LISAFQTCTRRMRR